MRIVFFNPSPPSNSIGVLRYFYSPMPPLWAGYLISIARGYTDEIYVIDNNVENLSLKESFERINSLSPDIVAISVLTQTANFSFKLSRAIRESGRFVVMGGPHATYFAEDIVGRGLADVVVLGEGEETFGEILKNFEELKRFKKEGKNGFKIPGAIMSPEEPRVLRERIRNIDSIPFPSWEYFGRYFSHYKPPPPIKPSKVLTFLASRGCPYSCNFCMVQMGRKYTLRSSDNISDEMEFFHYRFGIKHYFLADPLFPSSKKLGMEILRGMIRRGIPKIVSWSTETRADIIDDELAEALREAGCELVALGIEGGDQEILNNINKKLSIEKVENAVKSLKRAGVKVMGLYMLGTPGETERLAMKTIMFARKLKTHGAKFSITVPYPGTELFEKYILGKYRLKDEDWDYFSSYDINYPYDMVWTEIPKEKLLKLQRKANFWVNFRLRNIFWFLITRPKETILSALLLIFNLISDAIRRLKFV